MNKKLREAVRMNQELVARVEGLEALLAAERNAYRELCITHDNLLGYVTKALNELDCVIPPEANHCVHRSPAYRPVYSPSA